MADRREDLPRGEKSALKVWGGVPGAEGQKRREHGLRTIVGMAWAP